MRAFSRFLALQGRHSPPVERTFPLTQTWHRDEGKIFHQRGPSDRDTHRDGDIDGFVLSLADFQKPLSGTIELPPAHVAWFGYCRQGSCRNENSDSGHRAQLEGNCSSPETHACNGRTLENTPMSSKLASTSTVTLTPGRAVSRRSAKVAWPSVLQSQESGGPNEKTSAAAGITRKAVLQPEISQAQLRPGFNEKESRPGSKKRTGTFHSETLRNSRGFPHCLVTLQLPHLGLVVAFTIGAPARKDVPGGHAGHPTHRQDTLTAGSSLHSMPRAA